MTSAAPLILLLGMHRSGTSLLGSLLPALGVPLPGPLIAGDEHNPEGYYERHDVADLQEQLLINLNRWWPSSRGVLPLPEGWLDSAGARRASARLKALLTDESNRQRGPWAIKDPRTSLLLPLWLRLADELELPLRLVLSVREPGEVVRSLLQRDQLAAGMTTQRAQQLWWRHNRQALLDGASCPLLVVHYNRWFDPASARDQLARLSAFCCPDRDGVDESQLAAALTRIKPEHRRSLSAEPGPEALPERVLWLNRELQTLSESNASGQHLERLRSRLHPEAMASPDGAVSEWQHLRQRLKRRLGRSQRPRAAAQPTRHPWWWAALACSGSDGTSADATMAEAQLRQWVQHGLSQADLEAIRSAPAHLFPDPPLLAETPPTWPTPCRIVAPGTGLRDWRLHLWLQHCPLPEGFEAIDADQDGQESTETAPAVGVHLQPLPCGAASFALLELAELDLVLDPDPERVTVLRRLGIPARTLTPTTCPERNGWLERDGDLAQAEASLGLPSPLAMRAAGSGPSDPLLCLGSTGPDWDRALDPPLWCLPGFDHLAITSSEQARLLASWMTSASRHGLQLVRLNPPLIDRAARLPLPLLFFTAPIHPDELQEDVRWRQQGCPPPAPCHTPQPEALLRWDGGHGGEPATAAVCVSLFNYGDHILQALESARLQRHRRLELIVVDDHSSDGGPERVLRWMEDHGERFSRCQLLVHNENGGLASSRNTAFMAARAPWCFVLDADNHLDSGAVSTCLRLAEAASAQAAVVHPLIARCTPLADGTQMRSGLIGARSWQQDILTGGNQIDAMALIRCSAWDAVGGYTHIEGGWEDYDFWCKLIDAGFHGLICPQVLATYRSHDQSMTATTTRHGLRRISRVLQHRHPWLSLPWAVDDAFEPAVQP